MLLPQKPFALYAHFQAENGNKVTHLVYIEDGKSVDDTLWMLNKKANDLSAKSGVNIWLEDHKIVYSHDINYCLS